MYKVDYGKNPQANASVSQQNSNPNNSNWFPVRATQAPPPQASVPHPEATYNTAPVYNQAPNPSYYPQAHAQPNYNPQSQPAYHPQGYQPQVGYQPQSAYPQSSSQPHIQAAARGGGWQPSVMSVPTYSQQPAASALSFGSKNSGPTKCFRIQLFIQAALHAACAGTFLGIEIWAMYIQAWLANAALGIWAGFLVFLACAIVTVVLLCRPRKQIVLHVVFGFMIAGTIVGVGLSTIAGVGISYENNYNYRTRDNFTPFRLPTHIVKLICAVIEIAVCIWELLIVKARFEAKPPSTKPIRAPSVSASYRAASAPRNAGQPDVISGLSMPSSVVLTSTGPQPVQPPPRAFKQLPEAPDIAALKQAEAEQAAYAASMRRPAEDDTHTVETSDGEHESAVEPPARPSRARADESAAYDAPAPIPPRPTKRGQKQGVTPSGSEDEGDTQRPTGPPPPRPTRSKPPPPPPQNDYDLPSTAPQQPSAFDDPFSAPITRPAQPGAGGKRFYQYTDN